MNDGSRFRYHRSGWGRCFLTTAVGIAVLLLPAALASAEEPEGPDEAEIQAVARGLFELQQQMGGSIVTESDLLQAAPARQPAKGRRPNAKPPGNHAVGKVRLLRDTAWQLDKLANRFEYAGLYPVSYTHLTLPTIYSV